MRFGIFDHVDANGLPLKEFYEQRMKYVEAADRAGFTSYHIAEHHTTPLGLAPSPSVYLSAVAQRTQKLRFGPLVYILPMYHPLRLIEEISMLDQMSGGRLELGFGRGISPYETRNYAVDPDKARDIYNEYNDLIIQGLTTKEFTYQGQYYSADHLPMQIDTVQKPHPPLWYGIGNEANAERAGKLGGNCVSLSPADKTRAFVDIWKDNISGRPEADSARFGQCFFLTLDEDGERARDLARAGYLKWRESFHFLYYRNGVSPMQGERAKDFDEIMENRNGFAGTPDEAAEFLREQAEISGINYLVGQFNYGDMPPDAAIRSVNLFAQKVMPAFANTEAVH